MDIAEVEVWRIREPASPLRAEIDHGGIEELAESIRVHGLLSPIVVVRAGDGYEVLAGHRRLLAVRRLGLRTVACQVRGDSEADGMLVGAAENLIRRDMSVGDEARLVAALMGREGWGVGGAARALHRSEGWVRDRLDVLQWPEAVVVAVHGGRISLGAAKALMGIEDGGKRAVLLGHAMASGISVELARRWRDEANVGAGPVEPGVSLVVGPGSTAAPVGGRTRCFACGEEGAYVEMIYTWWHRGCAVEFDRAVRGVAGPVSGGA